MKRKEENEIRMGEATEVYGGRRKIRREWESGMKDM